MPNPDSDILTSNLGVIISEAVVSSFPNVRNFQATAYWKK